VVMYKSGAYRTGTCQVVMYWNCPLPKGTKCTYHSSIHDFLYQSGHSCTNLILTNFNNESVRQTAYLSQEITNLSLGRFIFYVPYVEFYLYSYFNPVSFEFVKSLSSPSHNTSSMTSEMLSFSAVKTEAKNYLTFHPFLFIINHITIIIHKWFNNLFSFALTPKHL